MSGFPHHLLAATGAHCQPCSGPAGLAALTIALRPFLLEERQVDTCIRLDGIALDLRDPRRQAGSRHRFPVNPQPGYIDGSLYLQHRHVPLDVTALAFGTPDAQGMPLQLAGTLVFSAAGLTAWADTPLTLDFVLDLPPTLAQVDAAIASAIAATGARTVRDAGRAMAWLVRGHPGWDDRQGLHARLCQHLSATGGDL